MSEVLPSMETPSPSSPTEQGASQTAAGSEESNAASPQVSSSTRRILFTIGQGLDAVRRVVDGGADDTFGADDMMDDNGDEDDDDDDDGYDDGSEEDDYADDENIEFAEAEEGDVPLDETEEIDAPVAEVAMGGAGAAVATAALASSAHGFGGSRGLNMAQSGAAPAKPTANTSSRNTSTKQEDTASQPAASTKQDSSNGKLESKSEDESKVQAEKEKKTSTKKQATKPDPLAPTDAAPYGYKIVKVKKADGSIAKVKRPLKAEEAAALAAAADTPPKEGEQQDSTKDISEKPADGGPKVTTGNAPPATQDKVLSDKSSKNASSKSGIQITEKEIPHCDDSELGSSPKSPEKPRSALRKSVRFMQILSWLIMIVFPGLFLALSAWAAKMNGQKLQEVSAVESSDVLSQAQKVAASLWPIVFAAVVAQTLKAYAAFKVERGIRLMQLEQLTGSNSLGGAIRQPFMLRKFNWMTIVLFVIWGLSPLAGQAVLRMFHPIPAQDFSDKTISWFAPQDMNISTTDLSYHPATYDAGSNPTIQAMYSGLLMGDRRSQNDPVDFWSNIKIPLYNPGAKQDKDGWYNVTYKNASMSSLLGIPVDNHGSSVTASQYIFNISTTYFTLTCSDWTPKNLSDPDMQALNFSKGGTGLFYIALDNNTEVLQNSYSLFPNGTEDTSKEPVLKPIKVPGPTGNLHFASTDRAVQPNVTAIQYSKCSYEQVQVGNLVNCNGTSGSKSKDFDCFVAQQKKLDPSDQNQALPGVLFASAMAKVGRFETVGDFNGYSNTEAYLMDPIFASKARKFGASPAATVGIARNVTATELSTRLGVLFNMLWMLGTTQPPFLGGDLKSLTSTVPPTISLNETGIRTNSNVFKYQVDWHWLGVLIACSVILLVAGVACAILEERTIGPEFLGFANTALQRSVKLPKNMNQLSARERLQKLQESEILLQDIRPQKDVGKIVLGIKEESSKPLLRGRNYM